MGIIIKTPRRGETYWLVSDPHRSNTLLEPTRVIFEKEEYVKEDDVLLGKKYHYRTTYFFSNGLRVAAYDSGLKIGYKILKDYYMCPTSQHIMHIMERIAYPEKFDIKPQDGFDYGWFRKLFEDLKYRRPELLI